MAVKSLNIHSTNYRLADIKIFSGQIQTGVCLAPPTPASGTFFLHEHPKGSNISSISLFACLTQVLCFLGNWKNSLQSTVRTYDEPLQNTEEAP